MPPRSFCDSDNSVGEKCASDHSEACTSARCAIAIKGVIHGITLDPFVAHFFARGVACLAVVFAEDKHQRLLAISDDILVACELVLGMYP